MKYSELVSSFNRACVLPSYMAWNKDKRLHRLREIEKWQWLDSNEIMERQFDELQGIIRYAYEHVPFYRDRFNAIQIKPKDVKAPDDIAKLPIVTKADLQENASRMVSEKCRPSEIYQDASGGSTGQPTRFYGDKSRLYRRYAATLMTDSWTGWKVGERAAYLWGADREVNRIRSMKQKLVDKFVFRQELLNAFSMTPQRMQEFAIRINRTQPPLIVAYANAAFEFARFAIENGLHLYPPKGIVCSAETLSPEKREVIQSVFHCKVLNRYGSRELGLISSECSNQQGLHINANDVYVEVLSAGGKGKAAEYGEVLVTDLANRVMPLIRYQTGDLARLNPGPCSCGRGLPIMGTVTGRTSDFIVHPDGRLVHGEFFSHIFYGIPGVRQFQIHQRSVDCIDVYIVANYAIADMEKEHLADSMRWIMGEGVRLSIFQVDGIAVPTSGKYRFAISDVFEQKSSIPL